MISVDVAIIGGGPAGSTTGALLKKYQPDLTVAIFEREIFPREHVGESQLPPIGEILDEMGCWDKVESANFPIKIGATYRWGKSADLWDFEFLSGERFVNEPRPARYEGQRRRTAFQVDRAVYDQILLDHAEELGCEVRQGVKVQSVSRNGDGVTSITLDNGDEVEARFYLDASGSSGLLRRSFAVTVTEPTSLRNIAIWDYWENATWAVNIGTGGTRVQVMSLGYGWLWFIPLGPTRTSIGLIVPAEYYRQSQKSPEALYLSAIESDRVIGPLVQGATREGTTRTTKDWSFVADRHYGQNWFLIGESAGFADPILAAGMTLAHTSAQECAYTILELERGIHSRKWLLEQFETRQKRRIMQHIRFADYWYTANAHFTDLQEFTTQIALDAGIELDARRAWQWLGQGGFISEDFSVPQFGGFDVESVKLMHRLMTDHPVEWDAARFNVFELNFRGAERREVALYQNGRIEKGPAVWRNGKVLPLFGLYGPLVEVLEREPRIFQAFSMLQNRLTKEGSFDSPEEAMAWAFQALDAMVSEGWVTGRFDPRLPSANPETPAESEHVHWNRDQAAKS
jgi:flavin-dependent dehydrogenase